ncbi:glutathione S-transferase [Paraburkholderia eburnea]|uniref:glutathione transferase n=1 Tax=Paraburkholderia eburnea TaxID=1189126 RepID=A0A2S4M8F4_9BURK|nr:glutathione S-transferase [Paraburkholderia eburnea]POR50984.1 glutathione S-transferase [Paraburkholderia eburnea]PRZ21719.1 glutathione S-transferase [Paraburkholderia eburnea]
MLTVHHLDNSRSQRILWMLEELGVDYEIVEYKRNKETMLAPPALRAVHPLGKSPVVTDGEFTLAESGAILEYLVERYGNGRFVPPRDTPDYLRYRYWMHYAEGSAMPPLLLKLVASRIANAKVPFFIKPITRKIAGSLESDFVGPQLDLHFTYIAKELEATGWFAGDTFTAADVQMSFPIEAGAKRAGAESKPSIRDYLDRIHARPAYQRALARGGEFTLFG